MLIANRQGVEECLNPSHTARLAAGVSDSGGVEFCDPHNSLQLPDIHDFPVGGISARQTARSTPRFRLPKAFPDKKHGAHDHPVADASAINMPLIQMMRAVVILKMSTMPFSIAQDIHMPESFFRTFSRVTSHLSASFSTSHNATGWPSSLLGSE